MLGNTADPLALIKAVAPDSASRHNNLHCHGSKQNKEAFSLKDIRDDAVKMINFI